MSIAEIYKDFDKYENEWVTVKGFIGIETDTIDLWDSLKGPSRSLFLSWQKINFADEGLDKRWVILRGKIEDRPCKPEVPKGESYFVNCGVYLVDYGILYIE